LSRENLTKNRFDSFFGNAFIYIIIIAAVSFLIRIFFTVWELPPPSDDTVVFFVEAYNFSHGEFEQFNRRFLWPAVLSIFFGIFRFEEYFEYVSLMQIISIMFSVASIPIVYLIAKKFVEKRFAILASAFFAFHIDIIEISTWTLTEPLFIFLGLVAFYFIIQNRFKYYILSFIFAGLAFDTRLNGMVLFILLICVIFVKVRPKKELVRVFVLGIPIFFIIISPFFFGSNPLGYISGTTQFDESRINPHLLQVAMIIDPEKFESVDKSQIQKLEITNFDIYKYSIIKEIYHLFLINIPIFLILGPIGIFFIYKNFKFEKFVIILIIVISFLIAIPQYTLSAELRNLLFLIPFLSILSVIGFEKICKNFQPKNVIIISLIIAFTIFSILILVEKMQDEQLVVEKERFGQYVSNNFDGKIMGDLTYHIKNNIIDLRKLPLEYNTNEKITTIYSYFSIISSESLIEFARMNNVSYVIIDDEKDNRYPIFQTIFQNDNEYEFLEKVFDSDMAGYQKLKVKIFKVN